MYPSSFTLLSKVNQNLNCAFLGTWGERIRGMPKRFLLVEDDSAIARIVTDSLMLDGYSVDWEYDGLNALKKLSTRHYDLVITDLRLPSLSGFDLLKHIKSHYTNLPVIMLSAVADLEEKLQGLKNGAEDYICKPFSIGELQIKVAKIMRSYENTPVISCGDLRLDRIKRVLTNQTEKIDIQEREFHLLETFFLNPDKVISKEQILRNICGYNFVPSTNVVDVLICRLRDKIAHKKSSVSIKTVRGIGYRIHTDPHGNDVQVSPST
ncbi:response regulator transcription factor [Bdellovibrio sp. SKB1291214]|uniref:response regulator transcription factor n=1 Tax=Bdellovibrio sp. SKB1291214 TaxID=1732569 RepID=UPI000B51D77F|nr:response regulator transcription factor [Bdellovibrio sp. SKB1291214]UYL07876.1 response regulator transcription factor [Bdellovibrio sp. SKB1291214]